MRAAESRITTGSLCSMRANCRQIRQQPARRSERFESLDFPDALDDRRCFDPLILHMKGHAGGGGRGQAFAGALISVAQLREQAFDLGDTVFFGAICVHGKLPCPALDYSSARPPAFPCPENLFARTLTGIPTQPA